MSAVYNERARALYQQFQVCEKCETRRVGPECPVCKHNREVVINGLLEEAHRQVQPIPMILTCPACSARHLDVGEFATKPHHTHACQACGMCWRPAVVSTVGVQFLPGFKNEVES